MDNITKHLKKAFFLTLLCYGFSYAQSSKLSGLIADENGMPLAGTTVSLNGKTSISDDAGMYTFESLKDGSFKITASLLGYSNFTATVTVSGDSKFDIVMKSEAKSLDEMVITGVVTQRSKVESSVSVSSVNIQQIEQAAPRATAEIFRSIPGVKSESTGGEGNANITLRGIPIASGGAKFLQLHEDGLPVMQFGDVAFGNADIFLRADQTIRKIEAIRGGSASTLASNSPAGIINFISKNGSTEGGTVMQSIGMDYNNYRTDFEYGTPINESLRFHIGGFWRQGEGPRSAGYTGNVGGQIKANLTKEFKNGYVRLYFKHLNDKAIGYLPMPVYVTGSNSSPKYQSMENFDIRHDALQSAYLLDNLTLDANGNPKRTNVQNGMNPIATSVGGELSFNLDNDWKIENRFRQNYHRGNFIAPFPQQVQTASAYATEFGVDNLAYANGPMVGQNVGANDYVVKTVLFDVAINNFNNFTNDLKLTKKFGNLDLTLGYYKALQNIGMTWMWNSYLMEAKGNNAALINAGSNSVNGLYAYGVPFWGNGLSRNYDTNYDINATYAAIQYKLTDKLNFDGSIRFDKSKARGTFAGSHQVANVDVDGSGTIEGPEASVTVMDNANRKYVNYDVDYVSYSAGLNYLLSDNQSLFGRYSRGGRANADRLLFGNNILATGKAVPGLSADMVNQAELGFKHNGAKTSLYATAFYAGISEQNWDFSTAGIRQIQREYTTYGLELEGSHRVDRFSFNGSVTWTHAEISKDAINPTYVGNKPRRQADFIYNALASYTFGAEKKHNFGFSVVGTSKSYAQDNNELVMPGYIVVNPFISFSLTKGLSLSANVNNVFDSIGITEVEEGSITSNTKNIVRARAINGRTSSLTLAYKF